MLSIDNAKNRTYTSSNVMFFALFSLAFGQSKKRKISSVYFVFARERIVMNTIKNCSYQTFLRKTIVCGLVLLVAAAAMSCQSPSSISQSAASVASPSPSDSVSGKSEPIISQPHATPSSAPILESNEQALETYATRFAKFFHHPSVYPDIDSSPHLFEFLITTTYSMLIDSGRVLENLSGKDYYILVHIPVADVENTAKQLLDMEQLPELLFLLHDFGYDSEANAFLHSQYSPPMIVTEVVSSEKDGENYLVEMAIKDLENRPMTSNITYTFKPIQNENGDTLFKFLGYTL